MDPAVKLFAIKFVAILIISPLIGFAALQIVENLKKALKLKGMKKVIALGIAGFLIAVLLGWLQTN
ncbi:MAG: hypothetical protein P0S96_03060 [Simkaniaceae bacterium]|nr:hypothetical protein [Candidatus Sacchlamyda saccharinae]